MEAKGNWVEVTTGKLVSWCLAWQSTGRTATVKISGWTAKTPQIA